MHSVIAGDSNLGALRKASAQQPGAPRHSLGFVPLGPAMDLRDPFYADHGDHLILHQRSPEGITPIRLPDPQNPGAALGLAMAMWPTRLLRILATDSLVLADRAVDSDTPAAKGRPVSRAQFRAMVRADMQHSLSLAHAALRLGLRPYAIGMQGLFRAHPLFTTAAPEQVLAMRAAYLEQARADLTALGVPIIDPPPQVFDAQGFMLERFRHPDPKDLHHANADFGALMLERVMDHLDTLDKGVPARPPVPA